MNDDSHVEDVPAVLVVGGGLSGIATALGIALGGRRAIVLESSDLLGGAAAYSGGMIWAAANHVMRRQGIYDDLVQGELYVRGIAYAHPELLDDQAMHRWLEVTPEALEYWEQVGAITWEIIPDLADYHSDAPGATTVGRYLTNAVIDGSELGEWRQRIRVSPNFPVGMTYAEMHVKGRRTSNLVSAEEDEQIANHGGVPAFGRTGNDIAVPDGDHDPLTFGTGVFAAFLARALREPNITIELSTPVTDLLTDESGAVTGVRAKKASGVQEYVGPVVLATSTYDWDPELVREFLGLDPEDFSSLAPTSINGAGISMARRAGAAVVVIPATSVPLVPGWASHAPTGVSNGPEYALPHCMMVDASGRRFCDDSYWVEIVKHGLGDEPRHLPFFLIWDEQHHVKYGLGLTPPGGTYPSEFVYSSHSLVELGQQLGIDGRALETSAQLFSAAAREGRDPEFGRGSVEFVQRFCGDPQHQPNPVLGPIDSPPYFGTRLKFVGTGIGSSGIRIDGDGHVLRESGEAIPGLFAAGSVAALTTMGSGYNSGFALGRGLTLAYLIAQELGEGQRVQ
jgi:3-oxosteroid 1-dehydrogenase